MGLPFFVLLPDIAKLLLPLYGSGFLLALYLAIFSYVANTFIQFLLMILLLPTAMSAKNPSYSSIVGLVVPVEQRGAANGLVSGAMSIGMGLAPFIAGPIFVSDVLKQTYTYGSFSHLVFWLGAFCAFMEFFIIMFHTFKYFYCSFFSWFTNLQSLETSHQCSVFFKILSVLFPCSRRNHFD